jgi:hypothetical protein
LVKVFGCLPLEPLRTSLLRILFVTQIEEALGLLERLQKEKITQAVKGSARKIEKKRRQ